MKSQALSKHKYKEVITSFKKDKVKNANKIIDIFQDIEDGDSKVLPSALTTLHKMFIILLKSNSIRQSHLPDDVQDATEKFSHWLYMQFEKTHEKLLQLLLHSVPSIRELSLISIVKLIQAEGKNPITEKERKNAFPKNRLSKLIKFLVADAHSNLDLISHLQEYMEYQDFLFYTVKTLANIVKQHKDRLTTEIYITNLYAILEQVDIPVEGKFSTCQTLLDDAVPSIDPCSGGEEEESVRSDEETFVFNYNEAKKNLNDIWMQVIRYRLPLEVYKSCLIHIPEKAMQHLKSPVKVTDFFMEAYNLGGAFSLLALQGVFILINKHNLDYPSFYTKLYSLLEPTVLHAKYKPRFFMLLNLFLSSSHLPEYLVAAFIKKLARLSLIAPSPSQVLIIKFIANLLVRFPSLKTLIHNTSIECVESDPYNPSETDPLKSKASSSSLWEIATLKSHANPTVSKAAAFVERNPPDIEFDISDFVETTYEEQFEKATKIHMKEIATTFHKPTSIFNYKDDQMSNSWALY